MKIPAPFLASAIAVALACAAAPVAAQNTGGSNDAATTSRSQGAAQDARSQHSADKAWENSHRASKIIGSRVENPKGDKVGTVRDLVLADPNSGQVTQVVIGVGGVSGLGDKLFAVPYGDIQRQEGKDALVLSGSSDLAHAFDDNDWSSITHGTRAGATAPASNAASTPGTGSSASTPGTSTQ
jgi:sporulation protein YlmC with PRC-barrel domain